MKTKLLYKENCLTYGMPGVAILVISLLAAMRIGVDFNGDTTVKVVSFLGCNLLLWMLYLTLFQYLPMDLLGTLTRKKRDLPQGLVMETVDIGEEHIEAEAETSDTDSKQEDAVPLPQLTGETYDAYCNEFERRKADERRKLTAVITDYVGRAMAPFVTMDHLQKLREETANWCADPSYEPSRIPLKPVLDNRDRLKSLDLKHFVWNIAVRLGFNNGYHGEVQAEFIKRLFPEILEDVETCSVARTLTKDREKGHIKLDEPAPDSYEFHF